MNYFYMGNVMLPTHCFRNGYQVRNIHINGTQFLVMISNF